MGQGQQGGRRRAGGISRGPVCRGAGFPGAWLGRFPGLWHVGVRGVAWDPVHLTTGGGRILGLSQANQEKGRLGVQAREDRSSPHLEAML